MPILAISSFTSLLAYFFALCFHPSCNSARLSLIYLPTLMLPADAALSLGALCLPTPCLTTLFLTLLLSYILPPLVSSCYVFDILASPAHVWLLSSLISSPLSILSITLNRAVHFSPSLDPSGPFVPQRRSGFGSLSFFSCLHAYILRPPLGTLDPPAFWLQVYQSAAAHLATFLPSPFDPPYQAAGNLSPPCTQPSSPPVHLSSICTSAPFFLVWFENHAVPAACPAGRTKLLAPSPAMPASCPTTGRRSSVFPVTPRYTPLFGARSPAAVCLPAVLFVQALVWVTSPLSFAPWQFSETESIAGYSCPSCLSHGCLFVFFLRARTPAGHLTCVTLS